jgi:hypothetical protein
MTSYGEVAKGCQLSGSIGRPHHREGAARAREGQDNSDSFDLNFILERRTAVKQLDANDDDGFGFKATNGHAKTGQ